MILFATVGLPASGKTTHAMEMVAHSKGQLKRVNRDSLRAMTDPSWSQGKEKAIIAARNALIHTWLPHYNVIVDDTNLSPKVQKELEAIAKSYGAEFRIIDFRDVHVEDCLKRDAGRVGSVGSAVILRMYYQYLCAKAPERDPNLPDIVICDIDGTIAEKKEGPGERGWFDEERVEEDLPRPLQFHAAKALAKDNQAYLIGFSGRSEKARKGTDNFVYEKYNTLLGKLFMRKIGDSRPDYIVKREMYEEYIKGKYNVVAIFDDRPAVLRMWEGLGYGDRLFRVGKSMEEF